MDREMNEAVRRELEWLQRQAAKPADARKAEAAITAAEWQRRALEAEAERDALQAALEQAHGDAKLAADSLGNSDDRFRSVERAFRIIEQRTGAALATKETNNDPR